MRKPYALAAVLAALAPAGTAHADPVKCDALTCAGVQIQILQQGGCEPHSGSWRCHWRTEWAGSAHGVLDGSFSAGVTYPDNTSPSPDPSCSWTISAGCQLDGSADAYTDNVTCSGTTVTASIAGTAISGVTKVVVDAGASLLLDPHCTPGGA